MNPEKYFFITVHLLKSVMKIKKELSNTKFDSS